MRALTDAQRLQSLMRRLSEQPKATGTIYFAGGATAVLLGWRSTTIDVDMKLEGDAESLLRAIPALKEDLDINVELASPEDFIPTLPGWRDRNIFVCREGRLDFYHYDLYSQLLSKIERGHEQDTADVREILSRGYVERSKAFDLFAAIEPELYRFPAIDPATFRRRVEQALGTPDGT